ncbi:FAD-binding and (Fe-S)-binding domain-containing protein [candidate division KSB1 bacterium]
MTDNSNLKSLERDLVARIRGDVVFDRISRGIYATDASNYLMMPVAVVLPRDAEDVLAAVNTAVEHGVSILPRGGGTSLAGQAVGEAMVLDFTKWMDQVLEVSLEEGWARVQPGIVRDNLNAELAGTGLYFAPDPATTSRATIGGMIANNSSGTRSLIYGKTVDHVLSTTVLLSDGETVELSEWGPEDYASISAAEDRRGGILKTFQGIIETNRIEIEQRFPKVMRRVSGYNLDEFIPGEAWNPAKLMVGSEGTLGVITETKINLEPVPKETALCIVHFTDLIEAIRGVEPILAHGPSAVEIFDQVGINLARQNITTSRLCDFLEGDPAAVLIVEFFGESQNEVAGKVEHLKNELKSQGVGYTYTVRTDAAGKGRVWEVRKKALGLLLGMKGPRSPIPFMEDACVPTSVLADYVAQVREICERHQTQVVMYAHASVGVIHIRPVLDLARSDDIERMKGIANEAFELVKGYGGSWTSEHGDGLARSPFVERFYGSQIYGAFKDVKSLLDPAGLMNPGKIVDSAPMDANLRFGTDYIRPDIPTEFKFRAEGGFTAAVEICSGVGECRKTLTGTMCPSFIATGDEKHNTRGRANALRLAITGRFGPEGLTDKGVYEAMELCLACKSCKSECPSNVDMAKLKMEFLQKYHDRHGSSVKEKLVVSSPKAAKLFSGPLAAIVNPIQGTKLFRLFLEILAGIDRRRILPSYAREPFIRWFDNREGIKSDKKVVLFDDCYMNYYEPKVGRGAVELLESCGYEVILARAGCCQRTSLSQGFLRKALGDVEKTIRKLDDYIGKGLPILVTEPSCASAFSDDYPDLLEDEGLGERLKANVLMIDNFLHREMEAGRLDCGFVSELSSVAIHGHCHQKALEGTGPMTAILGKAAGVSVSEIDSGCCGMAGSFGYEKEHYDLSLAIGEDRLLPAVRKLSADGNGKTGIVACGFSCRHQIKHATGVDTIHWVETVRGSNGK